MRKLLLIPIFLLLTGCSGIAVEYVQADRQTYEAIAPEYRKYVEADETLTEDSKALRAANLDSWDYRIKQAEKAGNK